MPRLYVIAGHGAGDPGACGNGYTEAERVRALAAAIKRRGGDSVVLLDTSRNWYADKGINQLSIPKGDCLVELHMNSSTPSARGGHVIIKSGIGGADAYDRAIRDFIVQYFPGRSVTIDERSDLANPNRAYARGINYRLVENGFISNAKDVATFNAHVNDLADCYLAAFGIKASGAATKPAEPVKASIEKVDKALYRLYNPNSGDHLITPDHSEAETVAGMGWKYEGIAGYTGDGDEVTRLYNPNDGMHMLTASHSEHDSLVKAGWLCEGESFRTGTKAEMFRLYNPNNGAHHFTTDASERDSLVKAGWKNEGVAFKVD